MLYALVQSVDVDDGEKNGKPTDPSLLVSGQLQWTGRVVNTENYCLAETLQMDEEKDISDGTFALLCDQCKEEVGWRIL